MLSCQINNRSRDVYCLQVSAILESVRLNISDRLRNDDCLQPRNMTECTIAYTLYSFRNNGVSASPYKFIIAYTDNCIAVTTAVISLISFFYNNSFQVRTVIDFSNNLTDAGMTISFKSVQ